MSNVNVCDPLRQSHNVSRNLVGVVHSRIFWTERPKIAFGGTGMETSGGRDGVLDGRLIVAVRVGMEERN